MKIKPTALVLAGLVTLIVLEHPSVASAAEIKVLCSNGIRAVMEELPVSEILPVHGVEVLGTFPANVQGYLVMTAGVSSNAGQSSAAKEIIKFLMAPAALPVIKKRGMERG